MYIKAGACIFVSALLCSAVSDTTVKPVDMTNEDINSVDYKHQNPSDVVKQIWEKRCGRQYNIGCLKMDLVKLIDRLDENTNFQILPGVSIVRSASSGVGMPTEMLLGKPDSFLDNYLVSKFTNYLSTLTINVKILDPALVSTAKSFGEGLFGADPETTATARRKNRFGQTMAVAGMMSGATLLAMGMSALAAMAGKALMTSLLSLMLSAISALKGHGDGHKSTTYEIVTRPVVTHAHSHSSEVQHLTGHGGHTAHDGGYGYARSMASTPVQPVLQEDIYQKYTASVPEAEGDKMAYRAHEPIPSYGSLSPVS